MVELASSRNSGEIKGIGTVVAIWLLTFYCHVLNADYL